MYEFISGAACMGSIMIGICFFRFYQKIKDRFFLFFALAFGFLGLERVVIVARNLNSEENSSVYLIRFTAFLIIIYAIFDKNRRGKIQQKG